MSVLGSTIAKYLYKILPLLGIDLTVDISL